MTTNCQRAEACWERQERPWVALFDPNGSFTDSFREVFHNQGIRVDIFDSLETLGSIGKLRQYNAIVANQNLGDLRALELARYLEVFFPHLPLLILFENYDELALDERWPTSVQGVLDKAASPRFIAQAIQDLLDGIPRTAEKGRITNWMWQDFLLQQTDNAPQSWLKA